MANLNPFHSGVIGQLLIGRALRGFDRVVKTLEAGLAYLDHRLERNEAVIKSLAYEQAVLQQQKERANNAIVNIKKLVG